MPIEALNKMAILSFKETIQQDFWALFFSFNDFSWFHRTRLEENFDKMTSRRQGQHGVPSRSCE